MPSRECHRIWCRAGRGSVVRRGLGIGPSSCSLSLPRSPLRPFADSLILAFCLSLLLTLSACSLIAPATPDLDPAAVTEAFYRWYIGYPGNAAADGAYQGSPYLAQSYIERIDALRTAETRGGADPFLLAQDVPARFEVGEAVIDGDRASVTLSLYWAGNEIPTVRHVWLEILDGAWRIVGVGEGR